VRVVYVDILFILNFITDYFLLLLTAKVGGIHQGRLRLLLGAGVGALFALLLYFLPLSGFTAWLLRVITCSMTVLVSFGFADSYHFLRSCGLFYGLTMLLAGMVFVISLWTGTEHLQNGVIYFNISIPVMLISFTAIFGLCGLIFGKGQAKVGRNFRNITVIMTQKKINFRALVDSGNLLRDPLSGKAVIVIPAKTASILFDGPGAAVMCSLQPEQMDGQLERLRRCCKTSFWLLPVHTAVQNGMLLIFRPDKVYIEGKETKDYIIGVTPQQLEVSGDCQAIMGA